MRGSLGPGRSDRAGVTGGWEDGVVTDEERHTLETVAGVLGVPREAFEARLTPPPGWKPPHEVTAEDW